MDYQQVMASHAAPSLGGSALASRHSYVSPFRSPSRGAAGASAESTCGGDCVNDEVDAYRAARCRLEGACCGWGFSFSGGVWRRRAVPASAAAQPAAAGAADAPPAERGGPVMFTRCNVWRTSPAREAKADGNRSCTPSPPKHRASGQASGAPSRRDGRAALRRQGTVVPSGLVVGCGHSVG